jgi:hypothetical protein
MQIGEPQRTIVVEPLEDPVPREAPAPERPDETPDPVRRPEPEPVPADPTPA